VTNIQSITANIERQFEAIETSIFSHDMFVEWRGAFEVKKTVVKKENEDIKYDLDIRLKHWPEGVYIKAYKHKALGVFCYVKDVAVCDAFLEQAPTPCKFWKESFYFSNESGLDQSRYVLMDGNEMQETDTTDCIVRINACIKETELIIKNA